MYDADSTDKRSFARPWWLLLLAVPTVIFMVGNHYTRQRNAREAELRAYEAAGFSPRVAAALQRAMDPVLDSPQVAQFMGRAPSATEDPGFTARASGEGRAMLPDAESDELARLNGVLAANDPAYCTGLWKGSTSVADGARALDTLSDLDLASWFHLSAMALQLRATHPRPVAHPAALEAGLSAIVASLPAGERPTFTHDLQDRTLSDARACELERSILDRATRLPRSVRGPFLRELAFVSVPPAPRTVH